MEQVKVSIIVPVYNAENYLDRCIRSLANQTLQNIEIILVDDSSTDSSLKICQGAAEKDNRFVVIHKENEGAGLARSAALSAAKGEYIGFVDSDDFVEVDMFQRLSEKADEYSADLVISGVIFEDGNMFSEAGNRQIKAYFEKDTLFETEDDLKKLKMGIVGALPGDSDDSKYGMGIWKNLFKNDIIKKNNLRFQSERKILSEDALFLIEYIGCIETAIGIKESFYHYCRNGASVSKAYSRDRFQKTVAFVEQVENRFIKDIKQEEYQIYIDRFWQAMCRVTCSQEILHSAEQKNKYPVLRKTLSEICTHPLTVRALTSYPIRTLPFMHRIFAFCMKNHLYFALKILVELRNSRRIYVFFNNRTNL